MQLSDDLVAGLARLCSACRREKGNSENVLKLLTTFGFSASFPFHVYVRGQKQVTVTIFRSTRCKFC